MKIMVGNDDWRMACSSTTLGNAQIENHHCWVHGETELEMLFQLVFDTSNCF
jgi:hypothetical protein